jgi:hypothetical protein
MCERFKRAAYWYPTHTHLFKAWALLASENVRLAINGPSRLVIPTFNQHNPNSSAMHSPDDSVYRITFAQNRTRTHLLAPSAHLDRLHILHRQMQRHAHFQDILRASDTHVFSDIKA